MMLNTVELLAFVRAEVLLSRTSDMFSRCLSLSWLELQKLFVLILSKIKWAQLTSVHFM